MWKFPPWLHPHSGVSGFAQGKGLGSGSRSMVDVVRLHKRLTGLLVLVAPFG